MNKEEIKNNIENRIIEFLKLGWEELPEGDKDVIEGTIRLKIQQILDDEMKELA